jgi:putative DNA primase/helicase
MSELLQLKKKALEGELVSEKFDGRNIHADFIEPLKFISYCKEHVIFARGFFYIYNESIGIWESKSAIKMSSYLLKNYYQLQKSVSTVNKIHNVIKHLTMQDHFPSFNGKNNVLVFENYAVIPETREKFEFKADFYARQRIGYKYDENAPKPLKWLKFLNHIFEFDVDKNEKINLIRQYMGLSTTTIVDYQVMLMLLGGGSNGKSVILNVVQAMLGGDYVSNVTLSDFNSKFRLGQIDGKLANIDHDLSYDSMQNEATFKAIVAGNALTNERKFGDPSGFEPSAKLWAAGNYLPKVKHSNEGYYRRIIPIVFNRKITRDERDLELFPNLLQELPGIFNWALDGLEELMKNKILTIPASSDEALMEYKNENDDVQRFIREFFDHLPLDAKLKEGVICADLYAKYSQFRRDHGYTGNKPNSAVFGKRILGLGVVKRESSGSRFYMLKEKTLIAAEDQEELNQ